MDIREANEIIRDTIRESRFLFNIRGECVNIEYKEERYINFILIDSNCLIKCVIFANHLEKLDFNIEDGLDITITAYPNIYIGKSEYQLIVTNIILHGISKNRLKFMETEEAIKNNGFVKNKKNLPAFITHVAIVGSKNAIEDIKKIAKDSSYLKITSIVSYMEGKNAKESIIFNLNKANSLNPGVIILTRGGGSPYELSIFNDMDILEAIHYSKSPVISAIGHENDYFLSDKVASVRAATPSHAINIVLNSSFKNKFSYSNRKIKKRVFFDFIKKIFFNKVKNNKKN